MSARRLKGRVAVVTGAAQGIGAVYAQSLASAGADVVIADIVDGRALADEIAANAAGVSVFNIPTDVSDEAAVRRLVAEVIDSAGKIDILVNNAAVFATLPPVKFSDIEVSLWDKVMAVNVRGAFLMIKHVAPHMIACGYGKIINIGSTIAYRGLPEMAHYVTSKGAILGLTRALSRELGEHGICVNTLAPGLTMSDTLMDNEEHVRMFRDRVVQSRAIKRDQYPADLIGALLFLASADSDFVTGQTIAVEGGAVNL